MCCSDKKSNVFGLFITKYKMQILKSKNNFQKKNKDKRIGRHKMTR